MKHKHRVTLHALFAHPISNNIDSRDLKTALEAMGAEVTRGGHGNLAIRLNGHVHSFHDALHNLSKDEVSAVRRFLEEAGVDPARDYPL